MFDYTIRRLLIAIPTLVVISLVIFLVLSLAPNDPMAQVPMTVPPEVKEKMREIEKKISGVVQDTALVEKETKQEGSVTLQTWLLYLTAGCQSKHSLFLFIFSFIIAESGYVSVDLWLA